MFTRKNILLMSGVGSVLSVIEYILMVNFDFLARPVCGDHYNTAIFGCFGALLMYTMFLSLPILIFSLITYRTNEQVFAYWRKFTAVYLLVFLILYVVVEIIFPIIGIYWLIGEMLTALLSLFVYTALSLCLIFVKYLRSKG